MSVNELLHIICDGSKNKGQSRKVDGTGDIDLNIIIMEGYGQWISLKTVHGFGISSNKYLYKIK